MVIQGRLVPLFSTLKKNLKKPFPEKKLPQWAKKYATGQKVEATRQKEEAKEQSEEDLPHF